MEDYGVFWYVTVLGGAPGASPSPSPTLPPLGYTNPWGYDFNYGAVINNPPAAFCSYFACIPNFPNGNGYVIQCNDGMFSLSGGISGSCSFHNGNWRPLYAHAVTTATPAPVTMPFAVLMGNSEYGYVSALTTPGAVCVASAVLPSGAISDAAGLQTVLTAGNLGIVYWSYSLSPNTTPGTGVHIVVCSYQGQTASGRKNFTVTGSGLLTLQAIDGIATLIADDGTYLGLVSSSQFSSDSICNQYGSHGSPYGTASVRNNYSRYGSPYATYSAYNPYTSSPPAIYYRGSIVGYLTKNSYHQGAVDPDVLFSTYNCVY